MLQGRSFITRKEAPIFQAKQTEPWQALVFTDREEFSADPHKSLENRAQGRPPSTNKVEVKIVTIQTQACAVTQ